LTVGDVKSGISSVADAGYLDVQPPSGEEWVVHNIYHEESVQLELYDGTNSLVFDSVTGKGIYAKFNFHVRNAVRIRVKNISGATKLIGYDGVQTK